MHLPDGIVSGGLSFVGYAATLGVHILHYITRWKKELSFDLIPRLSLISAALFIASMIYIPVGVSTVHFSFLGLAGILLGPFSFLAVTIALIFQFVLFYHGGAATLGLNIFNFGMAAMAGGWLFSLSKNYSSRLLKGIFGVLSGIISKLILIVLGSFSLLSGGYPVEVTYSIIGFHVPVIILEGLITGILVVSLIKVKKGIIYNELEHL